MFCANPGCHRESRYLREGSLYCIDQPEKDTGRGQMRFIWLCGTCAPSFVVETWRPPGEQLRRSAPAALPPAPHPEEQHQPRNHAGSREHHPSARRPVASHLESPGYVAVGSRCR